MSEPEMVIWRTQDLAKEYDLSTRSVGKLLRSIGAKLWRRNTHSNAGSIWYWDEEVEG